MGGLFLKPFNPYFYQRGVISSFTHMDVCFDFSEKSLLAFLIFPSKLAFNDNDHAT